MAFHKGKSGNPTGRPRGAKGKAPKSLQERVKLLVDKNLDQLQSDLEALTPAERVKALTRLIEFVLPKRQAVEVEADVKQEPPIKSLTQAEALEFIRNLEERY